MSVAATPPAPRRSRRSGAASAAKSLRFRLRDATAADHAALDAVLGAFDLVQRQDYRRFLEISAAALLPLEEALVAAGVAQTFPDWASRTRSRAIAEDLAKLGGRLRPLPNTGALDFNGVLGTLYVLEGSRFGAVLLARRVAASDDPTVAAASTYLRHGAGLPLWPSFAARLEELAPSADADAVVAAAHDAFALFARAAAAP